MSWKCSLLLFLLLGGLLPACTAKKKPTKASTSQTVYPKEEDLSLEKGPAGIQKINLQTFNGLPAKRAWLELKGIFGWKDVEFKGNNSTLILSAKEVYPWEALLSLAREGKHQFSYNSMWKKMVVENGDFPYVLARVVKGFLVAIPLVEREGNRCSFKVEIWKNPEKTKKNTYFSPPELSVKVSFDGGENLPYSPVKDRSHSFSFDKWNYQFEGPLPGGAKEMSIALAFKQSGQKGSGKARNLKIALGGSGKGKGVAVSSSKFEKKGKKGHLEASFKVFKGWKLQNLTLGKDSFSAYPSKISYEYSFSKKEYLALGNFADLSFEPEYISFLYGSEKSDQIRASWKNKSLKELTSRPNPPSLWGEIKIKNPEGKKIEKISLHYSGLKKRKRGSFSFNGSLGMSLREEVSPSGKKELRQGSLWNSPPYKSSVRGGFCIKKNRIFYELSSMPKGKYLFWAAVNEKTLAYPRTIMIDRPLKEGFQISLDKGASVQCLLVNESGKALSEMKVYLTLLDITGNEYKIFSPPRIEAKTDKKGYLKVSGLAPGLYKVTGSAKVKYGWRIFQEGINLRLKGRENYQGKLTVPLKK